MTQPAHSDPKRREINRRNASQPRISAQLSEALRLMVFEGLPRATAAAAVGMSDNALYKALRKPHVLKLRRDMENSLRDGASVRAYRRIDDLAQNAKSESVRLAAAQWLAGVEGVAPPKRIEAKVQHSLAYDGLGFADGLVDLTPLEPE